MSIFQAIQLTSSPDMGEEEQEHDGGEHEPEGGRRMWEQGARKPTCISAI